jgi:nucleoid DNA-binding protein
MAKKATAVKQAMTKSQIVAALAENTGLSKKEVSGVLDELAVLMERHVKKGAVGQFTLPGLLKVRTVKRPAQPARKGVPNPFKPGELMDIPAKPATTRVKVTALSKLKSMVN